MRNVKILILFISIAILIVGCSNRDKPETNNKEFVFNYKENEPNIKNEGVGQEDKEDIFLHHPQLDINLDKKSKPGNPSYLNEFGIIKVYKGKVIKYNDKTNSKLTLDFFFDPVCPASSAYNNIINKELEQKIASGEIEINYRPVPYLNDKTIDDYSNRASAYILAVAEYAPGKVLEFINALLSDEFQPKETSVQLTDDYLLTEIMEKIKIDKDLISTIEENKENFVSLAIATAKDFADVDSRWLEFTSLQDENGNGIIYTPFVLINKTGYLDTKSLKVNVDNPNKELINTINKLSKK